MLTFNPYIVIPFATWAVTQVTKFTIAALRGQLDFRNLYASGGMPSVHSAVVASLATTALLVDGYQSHLFGFAATFAAIVMYDSFGVRRSAGEQAAALNMIIAGLDRGKIRLDQPHLQLREVLGHQPSEVAAGASMGVVLGALFNYDRIAPVTQFLQAAPGMREFWVYVAVFAVILVGGIVQRFVLKAKYPRSRAMSGLIKQLFTTTQVMGWLGLVAALLQYERASYLSWRCWTILVLVVGLARLAVLLWKAYRTIPVALAAEADEARKLKWFNFGRKRKAKR